MSLREQLNIYEPKVLHNLGLDIEDWDWAGGCWIWDGKVKYLDFTSGGLMTAVCGHGDLCSSLNVYGRISTYYAPTRERFRAYGAIKRILPTYLDRYILTVTGGEAVETACRIVMDFTRCDIQDIARAKDGSFNGNLIGINNTHRFLSEVQFPRDEDSAVILCPFEGPTCRWWTEAFMDKVRSWQSRGGIVIFDECQGFARTGKWSGFEWYDIEPDIAVYGKGIANGLPISFVAGRHVIMDAVEGDYTSTHSGNAMCCSALAQTIEHIEEHKLLLMAGSSGVAIELWAQSKGYRRQGRGLAQAIYVGDGAKEVRRRCHDAGLLLMDTGAWIKIAPPLCITAEELVQGLGIIDNAIKEVQHGSRK